MSSSHKPYHEALLHWIWENRQFDFQNLATSSGATIQIHDSGTPNASDGPDFKNAEITIGQLRWYGDVEIHWHIKDWDHHNHQDDSNFNNVILHVVFAETEKQSCRADGTTIPTLCLAPNLSAPLQSFIEQYRSQSDLPCSGRLNFISQEAFAKQLEKAHREYFEQKVDDLLEFYNPSLPPSQAWLRMLAIALFDGLGISHNRRPMRALAQTLWDQKSGINNKEKLRQQALQLSGLENKSSSLDNLQWNHKGCRPANQPRIRIQQGADMLWEMNKTPFKNWLSGDPQANWDTLQSAIDTRPGLGKERASILFGTVFLPALYALGNLFHVTKLTTKSWQLWHSHEVSLPNSLLTKLDNTDLPSSIYARKLGTIHQLRSYCRPRNCQQCKVFKSAISS